MRASFEVCAGEIGAGWSLDISNPGLLSSVVFCPVYFNGEEVGAGLYAKAANGLLIVTIDLWRTFEAQLVALGQKAKDLYLSPDIAVLQLSIFEGGLRVTEAVFRRLVLTDTKYYNAAKKMQMLAFADMENYK